jgi:flagellar biosynthesis protein FliR
MNLHLENTVMAVACVGARVSGLLVFSPVLGSNSISPRLKVGLVILLVALLYPVCGPHGLSLNVSELAAVMLTELLAGLLMGIAVQIVFEAAQLAGQIIGMQVGFSLVNILDPNTQVETPVISVFTQMLVTLIFFQMNIHHWLLRRISQQLRISACGRFRGHRRACAKTIACVRSNVVGGGADCSAGADCDAVDGPDAGVSRQSFSTTTCVVSRTVNQKHGWPFGVGHVTQILAGNFRAIFQ